MATAARDIQIGTNRLVLVQSSSSSSRHTALLSSFVADSTTRLIIVSDGEMLAVGCNAVWFKIDDIDTPEPLKVLEGTSYKAVPLVS
jgi:hypothetical protein